MWIDKRDMHVVFPGNSALSYTKLMLVCLIPAAAIAGDLTGTILDDTGAPISGAFVTVHRSSINGALRASESYFQTAQNDGTFALQGLSAGPFVVCAVAPGRALLDPCQWNDSPPVVQVPETGAVSSVTQLQPGATISIHIDDPQFVLVVAPPGSTNTMILMGVWTNKGQHHAAWHTSSDDTGQNYALVIEPDVDLEFDIAVINLSILDSSNVPFDSSKRVNVNLTAGDTLQLSYTAQPVAIGIGVGN
jgi:hypothetical protein